MEEAKLFNPFGGMVLRFSQVDSTMKVIRKDPEDGKIIIAAEQTRGRGRTAGRIWDSAPGESLLFSLSLLKKKLNVPPTSIPIRAALALSRMLSDRFGLQARIKWPNDVLVREKKISGILGESSGDFLFIGLGLNCVQRSFGGDLRRPATSIFLETGRDIEPEDMLEALLPGMEQLFFHVKKEELPQVIRPWLYKIGGDFEVIEGTEEQPRRVRGRIDGIGPEGELRLFQKNGKIRSIYCGE